MATRSIWARAKHRVGLEQPHLCTRFRGQSDASGRKTKCSSQPKMATPSAQAIDLAQDTSSSLDQRISCPLATKSDGVYYLWDFPTASKLINGDSALTNAELQAAAGNDNRVQQLQAAYPHEILVADDVRTNNARNSYISVYGPSPTPTPPPPPAPSSTTSHLAGYTGLRSGELCGLRVEDLKLDDGVIEVRRAVWNGIEGETKTRSGRRNVFIDSATIRMLRYFLAGRKTGGLFQSRADTALENRDICRRVLTICDKLGIRRGGMHAFRHGRVRHMQASMMPGDFVKNQIGHSDLRTTSNYTHFEHKQKREMVEKLLSCTQTDDLDLVAEHPKAS